MFHCCESCAVFFSPVEGELHCWCGDALHLVKEERYSILKRAGYQQVKRVSLQDLPQGTLLSKFETTARIRPGKRPGLGPLWAGEHIVWAAAGQGEVVLAAAAEVMS